jgi:hypothetical protein
MARLDDNWQVVQVKDEKLIKAARKRARELELLKCIELVEIFKGFKICGEKPVSTKEKYNA